MNFHEIHSFLPLPRWLNEAYLQNMMTAPSQEKVMEFKETFTLLSQARCPCRPCRSCGAGFVLTCLLHPPPGANRLTLSLGLSLTFSDKTLQLLPVTCPWCHYHNRDGESMEEYGTMHWHVPHHMTHVCCVPVGLMFVVLLARWPGAFSLSLRGAHPPPRWRGGLRPVRCAGSWTAKGRAATSKCQGAAHDTLRWGRWGHRYGSWAGWSC